MDITEFILNAIVIIGVIAFSVSGALEAIDHRVDIFGVVILALITSFGGGLMRDIILGQTPPRLFVDSFYYISAVVSCVTALIVFMFACIFQERFVKREKRIDSINNVFDALALGVFATSGAKIAMEVDENNVFLVLVIAAVTAVGGGLLRDILLREVPFILKKRIYAVAVIIGALAYYLLAILSVPVTLATIVGVGATFTLRILATVFHWNFPKAIK